MREGVHEAARAPARCDRGTGGCSPAGLGAEACFRPRQCSIVIIDYSVYTPRRLSVRMFSCVLANEDAGQGRRLPSAHGEMVGRIWVIAGMLLLAMGPGLVAANGVAAGDCLDGSDTENCLSVAQVLNHGGPSGVDEMLVAIRDICNGAVSDAEACAANSVVCEWLGAERGCTPSGVLARTLSRVSAPSQVRRVVKTAGVRKSAELHRARRSGSARVRYAGRRSQQQHVKLRIRIPAVILTGSRSSRLMAGASPNRPRTHL